MNEPKGKEKTIRQLLSGTRYSIDFYQREYKWQTKQVQELLDDLATKFLDDYNEKHSRDKVQNYGYYYLGSIIISRKNNQNYVIDGQQRLTTLTLLLMHLHHLQGDRSDRVKLEDLIFSEKYGRKSFNLDVEERTKVMDSIYADPSLNDFSDESESIKNIIGRYHDIEQLLAEEIDEKALPYFADWLIENVYLVEITAYSDEDAYIIFETMNDRGLSLSPLDMLKGFLLANITDEAKRIDAAKVWKQTIQELSDLGKDEDSDAIKAWFRSQYANSIRDRKRGAKPQDFDRIGTEFHRWVREHLDEIGIKESNDFYRFIAKELRFYTKQYYRLSKASKKLTEGLEAVYFNSRHSFTLQYPVILAALSPDDDGETINRKIRIVSTFIDILIARRLWNFRLIAYSTMQYAMFLVMRAIRRKSIPELIELLKEKLAVENEDFSTTDRFRMHQQNRYAIMELLARMTDFIERESGISSRFEEYVASGKNKYEIEHIWANHFERHQNEFGHESDFQEFRNRIGGLLLLPKSFNASYSDKPYQEKLKHYFGQNLLAKSLHKDCYEHNPGFLKFIKESELPFKAHEEFRKEDLEERAKLYQEIAEKLWNPDRLDAEVRP